MKNLFIKELKFLFLNPSVYLASGLYFLFLGLMLWIFKTPYNILDAGFAINTSFFELAALSSLILIPIISMRSFSNEFQNGTFQLLQMAPLKFSTITLAKFLALFSIGVLIVLLSLIYMVSIYYLGDPFGNLDIGQTQVAYLALLMLFITLISISLFCSSISKNQMYAFLVSLGFLLLGYFGFDAISQLGGQFIGIEKMGLKWNYENLLKGVLDLRNIVYFLSISILFLFLTHKSLTRISSDR